MNRKFLMYLLKKEAAIGVMLAFDEHVLGRMGITGLHFLVWVRHFVGSSRFGIFD